MISSTDVPARAPQTALAAGALVARALHRVLHQGPPGVDRVVVLPRALRARGRAAPRGCTGTSPAAGCRGTRSTRCRAGSPGVRRAGSHPAELG